jgi:glucosamine--fructose-6-phosphate aminotransferase (isomerizing)
MTAIFTPTAAPSYTPPVKSLRNFPDPFLAEILAQPQAIRRAASGLADQIDVLHRVGGGADSARTIVFTGMGASYHACYPAITELAGRGIPALLVDTAELLHFRRPLLDRGVLVIAVSQSGESAEVVRLVDEVRTNDPVHRPFVAAVTNGLDNRLARGADVGLDTRAGEERGPSTLTFAASVVVLSGLVEVLAGEESAQAVARTTEAAEEAALAADPLLSDPQACADELLAWHRGRTTTVLLGRGPARAASEMGALLLKESAGIAAEALQAAQFRHGPLELAGPELAAVVVATERETRSLDLGLAADLVASGSSVLVVSPDPPPAGALGIRIGPTRRTLGASVSIVPVQLLAWGLAVERGRTPGMLTRASKVTTRE